MSFKRGKGFKTAPCSQGTVSGIHQALCSQRQNSNCNFEPRPASVTDQSLCRRDHEGMSRAEEHAARSRRVALEAMHQPCLGTKFARKHNFSLSPGPGALVVAQTQTSPLGWPLRTYLRELRRFVSNSSSASKNPLLTIFCTTNRFRKAGTPMFGVTMVWSGDRVMLCSLRHQRRSGNSGAIARMSGRAGDETSAPVLP